MRAVVGCFTCLWLTAKEDTVNLQWKTYRCPQIYFCRYMLHSGETLACAKQTTAQKYRWPPFAQIYLLSCVGIMLRPWLLLEVAERWITDLLDSVKVYFQRNYRRGKNSMYCSALPDTVIPDSAFPVSSSEQNWKPESKTLTTML